MSLIVVKVGGSLFDHPRLAAGLRAYLDSLAPAEVVVVAGGGRLVDAVRELDHTHELGDEAAHWLAIRAMDVMGEVLSHLINDNGERPGLPRPSSRHGRDNPGRSRVLGCYAFLREDDARPGALPHSWDVTSDSIAARAATVLGAERLVLLKSVGVQPGTPWVEAEERGWVDRYFPRAVAGAVYLVQAMNFRRVLDLPGQTEFLDHPGGCIGG